MDEGLRFAIREGGRTVGSGRVVKITAVGSALSWQQTPQVRRSESASRPMTTRSSTSRRRRSSRPCCARRRRSAVPFRCPTEIRKYTVIRSPHVDKDSREHFEMRIHKRLIDIVEITGKTVDSLQRLDLARRCRRGDQAGLSRSSSRSVAAATVGPEHSTACASLGVSTVRASPAPATPSPRALAGQVGSYALRRQITSWRGIEVFEAFELEGAAGFEGEAFSYAELADCGPR